MILLSGTFFVFRRLHGMRLQNPFAKETLTINISDLFTLYPLCLCVLGFFPNPSPGRSWSNGSPGHTIPRLGQHLQQCSVKGFSEQILFRELLNDLIRFPIIYRSSAPIPASTSLNAIDLYLVVSILMVFLALLEYAVVLFSINVSKYETFYSTRQKYPFLLKSRMYLLFAFKFGPMIIWALYELLWGLLNNV